MQEEILFDAAGRQINPNLTNYIMPTSLDMPTVEVDIVDSYDPTGPFGAKGVGEPTCVSTAAAILVTMMAGLAICAAVQTLVWNAAKFMLRPLKPPGALLLVQLAARL